MQASSDYETLLRLLKTRTSIRNFKPDPVPDEDIEKILEAGRWAMSGANAQPWEFIVVKNPETRRKLHDAYTQIHSDFSFWMEKMRLPELRHPSHQLSGTIAEQYATFQSRGNWGDAPVHIAVLGDGRKQWGTVMAGQTHGRHQSHFTDAMANTSQFMHLAAATLGLGTQWVSMHIQEPFKRILNVPDLLTLHIIIPVGYPAAPRHSGYRHKLASMVHHEQYDPGKFLSNEQIVEYVATLRRRTIPKYQSSYGNAAKEGEGE